jgi:hypothetical protein
MFDRGVLRIRNASPSGIDALPSGAWGICADVDQRRHDAHPRPPYTQSLDKHAGFKQHVVNVPRPRPPGPRTRPMEAEPTGIVGLHPVGCRADPPVRGRARADPHRRPALTLPRRPTRAPVRPRAAMTRIDRLRRRPSRHSVMRHDAVLAGIAIAPHVRVPFSAHFLGVPRLRCPSKGIA